MPQEAFCPEHGPYDASLGDCPYPHTGTTLRPGAPLPLEDDLPTDLGNRDGSGEDNTENGTPKKFRTEGKNYNLRVFVSSTFEDLKDYREEVFKAIHSMLGYADDMLFWSADERDSVTVSLDRVRQCDLVILLIAYRYGNVPVGQKYSITELEYRTAKEANIPVLAFFVDEKTPWLRSQIEIEKQGELAKFKKLVEADLVRKTFGSADELHALVTEALHHFIERHRRSLEGSQFQRTLLVKSQIELKSEPDILISTGESEDKLPLLLKIKRSQDLGLYIDGLARSVVSNPFDESINELLDSFRDQLERHAAKAWASSRIFSVRLQNGSEEEMYVTQRNLSELTSSLLHKILSNSKYVPPPRLQSASKRETPQVSSYSDEDEESPTQLPAPRSGNADSEDTYQIQSIGGLNRFLGISTINGQVYSVGIDSGNWVEWHPFYQESIPDNFSTCEFTVNPFSSETFKYKSFGKVLNDYCLDNVDEKGSINASVQIVLSRQSIGEAISRIAAAVARFHTKGIIHGDLKPKNILLTRAGTTLIDDLNLQPGDESPGWTPHWSAPEQVLQAPITYAADIYPLGLLVLNMLGGRLLGEVRKFVVPTINDPEKEHNVFYNPSVFIEGSEVIKSGKGKWISFVESCLRFDSRLRPQSASDFLRQLSNLLDKCPLSGNVSINLENGSLVAATMLDGSKKVAKMIEDEF